ncbi:MAG: right-handed parallel beta-helix repeat-containing protein [Armatimonadetes bacterium]|nr:right-handed parallel beta-helix repeat-containing protein [Armatimonadota bacterium]
MNGPVRVFLRAGTWYLAQPLICTADDAGTQEAPVVWRSFPGEQVTLCGGLPVTGWKQGEGGLWTAFVRDAEHLGGKELIVAGRRQIRARHPNFDPQHPTTGGYLFARAPKGWTGGFGARVGSIHNPGDWLEYQLDLTAAGEYTLWLYYGAANKPFGNERMDGRTQVQLDGGAPIPLINLPDTGDWGTFAWSDCAKLTLPAGRHVLRWTNNQGGGLNLDAWALSDDPAWKPAGTDLKPAAEGRHALVIQCECFSGSHGTQMTVDKYVDPTGLKCYFDPGALHAWPASPDKLLHAFIYEGGLCSNTVVPVAAIDEAQGLLTTTRKPGGYMIEVGARLFVDNVREALDAPGEWYLNRATGVLSWLPDQAGFAGQDAILSNVDRLIELRDGAAWLRLEGLTFEATDYALPTQDWYHSDSASIWLRAAEHCQIAGCRFTNLGATAVVMVGACHHNAVTDNEIAYCGAGGVTINGNPDNRHLGAAAEGAPAEANLIAGNHIHHTGLLLKHGNPVCLNSAERNAVLNNTIHDVPRMGILLTADCGGNRIEQNDIRRTSLETGDTGAIYAYAVNKLPEPNVIAGNVIVDSVGMGTTQEGEIRSPHYAWGIYIDGESSGFQVHDNLVVRTVLGGVFINGGHGNVVENNVLVDGAESQFMYSDYAQRGIGNVFRRNLLVWTKPEARLGLGNQKDVMHLNSDDNLFWHNGAPVPELAGMQERGFELNSVVADPLFVDPGNDDYTLRPDSPALKLGFKPLDLSGVGAKGWRAP